MKTPFFAKSQLIPLVFLASLSLVSAQNPPPAPFGKPLTTSLSDKVSLDMVWIAPGTFLMGIPEVPGRRSAQAPRRK